MPVYQTVLEFIQSKSNSANVNVTDKLLNNIKSFDFMMLIIELEQKYNIELPFEQAAADNLSQINHFIHWVEQHYENQRTCHG
ncbi:acyl carrier protein [Litorilituus sediminis]|uniref:Acyl carrier protein n=1 Tax=Litorilituus sediminis TaxID=718192 RepID=A0A4V0ZG83_9GAMM|nr:acyl carrier protein [Litorilituus sediminis]QBG36400.1 acyl carrier protein [Litorilituus sediminis]